MKRNRSKLQWARHQDRWFGKWHVYLGIIAGIIVTVVGLTGSILVFEDEIDVALNKSFFTVEQQQQKIPIGKIIPLVKEKYPDLKFSYAMNETDEPDMAYRFYDFTTEQEFFINPYTATLSGKRIYESSFVHIVTDIHTALLIPAAGKYITGIASLILLILTITGLRLWIPQKWKQLKSVLTVKFGASFKRQNYDWHNVIGFYSAPVVAFLSLTGVCITFSIIIIPSLFILSGKSPQGVASIFGTKSAYTKGAVMLTPEQAAAIAHKEMPASRIGGLALPLDSTGVYRFDMLSPGLPKDGKREMLMVDLYSGKVLLDSRKDFPEVGNAYLSWLTPVHYGSFGGWPTKILACLGGLTPLALFITGFIIWYPRWRKQKKAGARHLTKVDDETLRYEEDQKNGTIKNDVSVGRYFVLQLKKGFKYALWTLAITIVMGILYGIISGIIIQPPVFGIAFTTVLVVINFVVALLCILFNIIFLAPFKKGSRMLVRYFSLSFSFFIIFMVSYQLLLNTGLHIF
ncbi:PepSY domain-containing protein [Chitinophaga sp. S165]|uniref:PepSY-associated TM helix domain-containing protein n=1 Tax=Chitinophaga sp. S165 TaxID=2135462 RepID=UPI000D714E6F|nr:PepSY-associated TM helix domain-containing protein [Chitinophaga sp. S165]PWV56468.1 putative iron-regulated membrane protein [Chitinophaga sp. S165]